MPERGKQAELGGRSDVYIRIAGAYENAAVEGVYPSLVGAQAAIRAGVSC